MAASLKFTDGGPMAPLYFRAVDVAFDSSYPSGGYAVSVPDMRRIVAVFTSPAGGYDVEWNSTTGKLVVYRVGASNSAPLAEVGAGTSLSGITAKIVVIGDRA